MRPTPVALGLAGAAALVPLSSTMIAVALTDLERDLGAGVSAAALWLVSGYLVVAAIGQPMGGRIGDRLGHRRVFLAGLALFLATSALAAIAPSFPALVAARAMQAAAGALMVPSAVALLREFVPPERRGRAFGWFGLAMALGAAVGPVVGGALVDALSWRATFLVNVPLGVVAGVVVLRARPAAGTPEPVTNLHVRLGNAVGTLLRLPAFRAACMTMFLQNFVVYGLLLLVPLLAERRLNLTPGGAGLMLAALTAPMLVSGPLGGALSDRSGRRLPVLLGGAMVAAGVGGLLAALPAPPIGVAVALLLPIGAGVGLAAASLQTAAVESAPPGMSALASGLYTTSRYLGGIPASGLVAAVAGSDALGLALALLTAAAAVGLVTCLRLPGPATAPAGALATRSP
jgi:MFS family permease